MRTTSLRNGLLIAAALVGSAAGARRPQRPEPASSEALQPVLACRAETDAQARLACFDRTTQTLQDATAKHDIVVLDQKSVTDARRSLFGFSMPSLDFLKSAKPDAPEQSEISSTVRSARQDAEGNWIVTIDDGAVWHQTSGTVGGLMRAGDKVVIRRASLGSYFLRLGSRPGVRAKREG